MRLVLSLSLVLLLLALVLPLFLVSAPEAVPEAAAEAVPDAPEAEEEAPEETPEETPFPYTLNRSGEEGGLDSGLQLQVLVGETVQEMTMAQYLNGVVAAEMPVTFDPEALRAQAVAARTYTLYKMLVEPSERHPEAYVCDDYTCCKAYKTEETLREQWGEDYDENAAAMAAAVADTDGVCMLYDGGPILAAFHSSSDGQTEASGAVWSELPYLQSVRTFESESEVPGYYTAVELTYGEFRETVEAQVSGVSLGEDTGSWISDIVYTDTGRIETLNLGGVTVAGTDFRTMFDLRSTAITFDYGEEGLTMTTSGYGHGVGMSQYGANTLAGLGLNYEEILHWYYTDISLDTMDVLFPDE